MDAGKSDALAALGEFFALPAADPASWRPIASLCGDQADLHEYTMRTRAATASGFAIDEADVPVKAAASSVHLSITARLLSPAVGAAVCLGTVPVLTLDSLFWQQDSSHRPALGAAGVEWVTQSDPRRAAALIADSLIGNVLRLLNATMRRAVALPPQVMWGNIASAANGAVTVLAQSRPDAQAGGHDLIDALIAIEPLRGTSDLAGQRFRRRSCCLFYQVPGGGYCGDCVFPDGLTSS
ncbi:(2Fe-2S)-binding protein [Mycobacterium sp. DL440]|uniref:(2Fe-2S)-binding protein n=1 Tax=Mycobacterium sp. DL440 TaxID=2675523 RepID=UPI001421FCCA|nr:(2Fe-2S)-binding protein [Mycobacterium sp. DL440]